MLERREIKGDDCSLKVLALTPFVIAIVVTRQTSQYK